MNIKKIIYNFLGKIYIPKNLIENNDPILIHISDTPVFSYRAIKKMIQVLGPKYLVHTGDISDDLKVEMYPNLEEDAKKKAYSLIDSLITQGFKSYISLGNHDSYSILSRYADNTSIEITDSKGYIELGDKKIAYSHYSNLLKKSPGDINLYGHDLSIPSQTIENKIFLNGIESINIINLNTFEIFKLDYPAGTDSSRLRKFKTGL
ncbi:MAG: metallophosphoesterase [Firmicutes bacterium]|nr:metallophosphoesterase [Bacillota bacterium]